MSSIFNKSNGKCGTPREICESKYNGSIVNLLLIIAFSVINIVLLVTGSDTYFLFSAFIPYFLADYGMYMCGMYPEEYYYDVPDMEFYDKTFLGIAFAIAVVILLVYFLCWIFARKKKVGWLIFALVFFAIDTVAMFVIVGISTDWVVDIIFHAWVIFSLVSGIVNYNKLKKLLQEEILPETGENIEQYGYSENRENSEVLRMADNEVKSRVLLEAEVPGYRIVYRRVKKINELVVNDRVYDEYEALIEVPHTLTALIDGHKIEVTYDTTSHMYIIFDGEQLAKKIRLV